ncbi:zinc finger HIT domain-containing protein 2 [Triplophysa rosa]|uniref:Zinc finger HIT domain-containing protein 2 n=1 Tax=Triplophysa rosa TaxID=992332 RepID=A0A9W7T7H0_TRIRA|nr:zinc finger HIT domain-containing protein 2 [Triplophysa rosa]KAI7793195.1 zinc finger HIT domain-containing protein 2 [Triplophysa rosa]
MDPVVRRKIPGRLRSLLTDIAPREEQYFSDWQETDPESVNNDRIVLPKRGTSETLLTPATEKKECETTNGNVASSLRPCGLCLSKPSCYTCPRCNIPYCGLVCYRSPDHSACSEEFYKESVLQELKSQGVTDEEGKSKMQEILLRLRQSAEDEGGTANLLRDLQKKTGTNVTQQDADALELLSRLAVIQSAGNEDSQEAQEILTKLQDIEESGNAIDGCDEEEEEAELTEKLAGLDIDSLTEEELWSLLSAQEKEKFEALVKGGGIGGLVALWCPWWENPEKDTKTLIEELKSENDEKIHDVNEKKDGQTKASVEKTKQDTRKVKFALGTIQEVNKKEAIKKDKSVNKSNSSIPAISAKIPALHTLSSNPSPLVLYNLVNVIYGYTFSLCLVNGDISEQEMLLEFCQVVLGISEVLGEGRVFSSVPEAVEAGITAVSTSGHFDCEDPRAPLRAVKAVAHVLSGKSRENTVGYSLSALSQLRSALNKAKNFVPKADDQARRMYFKAGKKCEFFQSWLMENSAAVRSLAGQVWMDYERRDVERMKLEGEKKDLEVRLKKSRGKGVLIEEIE